MERNWKTFALLPRVLSDREKHILGGDEVLYAAIFDFALTGVGLSTLVFFVWCWFAFREDRKHHPIYRKSDASAMQVLSAEEERRCA